MTPSPTCKGLTFLPLPPVTDLDVAFGFGPERFFKRDDLPEVPQAMEFAVDSLFFRGGALPELRDGIDRVHATKLVRAWLGSWEPAHQAKIATVAYAFWVWMSEDTA